MADMQSQLSLGAGDATAKTAAVLVIAAVVALALLRRLSGSVSVGIK